ncbi:MAG: hypothetical protein AAFW98_07195 [Pseudomonadota bacterium]
MTPFDISAVQAVLPDTLPFPYFADRESPWLLAQRMEADARVGELKRSPLARWLDRPLVKPVVAHSGGVVRRADLEAVAYADRGIEASASAAATAGLVAAYDIPWHDFELSFGWWGTGPYEHWAQMSRAGGNLVMQLGFPSDHAALMGRYLPSGTRKRFEYAAHPVRTTGRPTLAWARIDVDSETCTALVEEVQTDWLRFAARQVEALETFDPRSRHLKSLRQYDAGLRARYGKLWPKATLLAALAVLRDGLGIREVFMHQPGPGQTLKRISGQAPPVSLYSALPKSFGFEPTDSAPPFLQRQRKRDLSRLRRGGAPIFWRLSL